MRHLRDVLLLAAGILASAVLLWSGLATRPDPAALLSGSVSSLQGAAGFAAAGTGLALALWWVLGLMLSVLSALLHRAGHAAAAAAAGALAPAFMRRLAVAVIGVNLVAGSGAARAADSVSTAPEQTVAVLQTPAHAAGTYPAVKLPEAGSKIPAPGPADSPAAPQWKPTGPPSGANVFIRPGRADADDDAAAAAAAARIVVREGDSLWSLAAGQLGPQAGTAEIAAHWPRWYERNRAVVGNNPDLIVPGQVLEAPEVPGT